MVYAKWIEADGRFAFSLADNGGRRITASARDALLVAESLGKVIAPDADGAPILIDAPGPTDELRADQERAWRDAALASVMWLRERHRDQQDIGGDTTLSGDQFAELLVYMQALRDWPQSPDFPDIEQRRWPPAWIAEQTQ